MKLSPHVLTDPSPDARRLVFSARCPVVKLVDNWGDASYYANLPHRPLVIGRRVIGGIFEKVSEWRSVQAWEGRNEVKCSTPDEMRAYAHEEAVRTENLALFGRSSVVGNFSTGQPEVELWPYFQEAFDAIKRYGGYLGLHEYGGRAAGWNTWNIGRFIRVPGNCPIIITEHGADDLPPEQGGTRPWRQEFENVEQYAAWLIEQDRRYRQYARIIGTCLFTFGTGWAGHNVEGTSLAQLLIDYDRAEPDAPIPQPTPPTGETMDARDRRIRENALGILAELGQAYWQTMAYPFQARAVGPLTIYTDSNLLFVWHIVNDARVYDVHQAVGRAVRVTDAGQILWCRAVDLQPI